jgi:uncharacterized linocin/CFP29 family protein
MAQDNGQVPWTEEQWARANQVILEEANRARVAAKFLPLYGPLPSDTDFVRVEKMSEPDPYEANKPANRGFDQRRKIEVDDISTIPLTRLQVNVYLRGAQLADPNMTSALQIFRRAANVLARLEDAVVFRGTTIANAGPPHDAVAGLPGIWQVLPEPSVKPHGPAIGVFDGLLPGRIGRREGRRKTGEDLVTEISERISTLESNGHYGPFVVVLGHKHFEAVQTPSSSFVLPQDRILPFLGGGALYRSSTLPTCSGMVMALGGEPADLVIAKDMTLEFLQVTQEPSYVFRVYEKIALRIKQAASIVPRRPPKFLHLWPPQIPPP